ncbi:MAG TPA: hypothetical protein VGQ18_09460 [Gemmatimonadales bacterium]|jgi:hypothetical protein|nr:hypothetical protein [Gemmatimonadales bacterium]
MNPGMIGVFIPIVAVGGFFAWMISLSPMGRALADRLRHGPVPPGSGSADDHAELQETVEQLRREVAELAERVDFTERLLGQQQGAARLGPPRA